MCQPNICCQSEGPRFLGGLFGRTVTSLKHKNNPDRGGISKKSNVKKMLCVSYQLSKSQTARLWTRLIISIANA